MEKATDTYHCSTCRTDIELSLQKSHIRSDWHCYNLKRIVVSLPIVSLEEFQKKQEILKDIAPQSHQKVYCDVCKKIFFDKTYTVHLNSKCHRQKLKKHEAKPASQSIGTTSSEPELNGAIEENADEEEVEGEEEEIAEPLALGECLFCSKQLATETSNLDHMRSVHSFRLPYLQHLVDRSGLMANLAEQIGVDRMCLWCGQQFISVPAVQQHMRDKGHNCLYYEGAAIEELAAYYDGENVGPEFVLEDLGADSDLVHELRLPSGLVLGHRSLQRYYRQSLPTTPTNQIALFRGSLANPNGRLAITANGGEVACSSSQLVRVRELQNRATRQMMHDSSMRALAVGCKANKLQRYFRRQDLMF